MGQKYAAYDATGAITGFYDSAICMPETGVLRLAITDDQWQACLASQGGFIVQQGALVAAPPVDPAVALSAAKTAKIAALSAACAVAICAGFKSSALGTTTAYPSLSTDQLNLQSSVQAAAWNAGEAGWTTPLWCEQEGTWAFADHTAAQVQAVNGDWVSYRRAAQQKYADLIRLVNEAATVEAVDAINAAA
ncbi:hypothetical protein [Paraburkholderia fungorum]|uniref:DUF4376 domain-containing protein n=1 Tax=Paraburkholderia fungorum TaxID=134537 RepID=UPI0004AADE7B|nr:hypothetical protein [Paraburkholderia fungorum]KFX61005.1 hypothetical protein KBK24_0134490 [Burkholderia sp. K24]